MKFLHDWNDSETFTELTPLASYLLKIADFEAIQVDTSSIDKVHHFLSVLQLVDIDLATIEFGVPLLQRDPILISVLIESTKLRKIYSLGKLHARRKTYSEKICISNEHNVKRGKVLKYSPWNLS